MEAGFEKAELHGEALQRHEAAKEVQGDEVHELEDTGQPLEMSGTSQSAEIGGGEEGMESLPARTSS